MRKYYIIANLHAHVKTVWCKTWCFYLKEALTTFSCCQHLIQARWHSFVAIPQYSTYDSEDSEDDSDNEVCFPETEVSLLVEKDDIAVIKISDAHSYYLLKLSCQPYIMGQIEKDSYNHTFAGNHKAIKCHYLEIFKGNVFYLDDNKTAWVFCFSVVGVCPDIDVVQIKRKQKIVSINFIYNENQEALCNLVVKEFWWYSCFVFL